MKIRIRLLVVLATLMAASSHVRLTAQNNNGTPRPYSPDSWSRLVRLRLINPAPRDAAQREAAREEAARLAPATYDLNLDGRLDENEFAAWESVVWAALEQSRAALKKYDKDHDKRLDDAEWAVACRALLGH